MMKVITWPEGERTVKGQAERFDDFVKILYKQWLETQIEFAWNADILKDVLNTI